MVAPMPDLRAVHRLATAYFPRGAAPQIERAAGGGSTFVYRIMRGDECFYLRVLPEIGDSFAPEARAHALLRQMGVSVPDVLAYEHRHAELGLSVMLTTEIAGEPLSRSMGEIERAAILFESGRELARINSIPVSGFGWIRRDSPAVTALSAELPTNSDFLLGELAADLALLSSRGLAQVERVAIEAAAARCTTLLDTSQGWLAHGDFDPTHIYGQDGRYTGIIDLGEMRGADRAYDLGHFALRAWEANRSSDLGALLAGYATVSPLSRDAGQRIALIALLIGVRASARRLRKRDALMLPVDVLRGVQRALAQFRAPDEATRDSDSSY